MPKAKRIQKKQAQEHPRVHLRIGEKKYSVSYEQAFACAHVLLVDEKYRNAESIFETLLRLRPHDSQVMVFLAQCAFVLSGEKAAGKMLQTAFAGARDPSAQEILAAFSYWKLGLLANAVQEMENLAKRHGKIPAVSLLLGDMLYRAHRFDEAAESWEMAAKGDKENGSVAQAAHKLLQHIEKKRPGRTGRETSGNTLATGDRPGFLHNLVQAALRLFTRR